MNSSAPVLVAEKLTVAYGDFVALQDFDAVFESGACGLLGPNGAGKSSLLRALLGLIRPRSGRARVLGYDVASEGLALRERIGYMPERDAFVPGASAVQTLTFLGKLGGLDARTARARAHETLYFAGLGEARYRSPEEYSTGMRQRARLAAALVHDPDLVFLDEPTNGLDPKGREDMLTLIQSVAERGVHVLLASHLLPDVERVCEQVLMLDRGRLVGGGRLEELIASKAQRLLATLRGSSETMRTLLDRRGLRWSEPEGLPTPGAWRLEVDGLTTSELFALAHQSGQIVLSLEPQRRHLEEVFLEVLGASAEAREASA